MRQAKCATSGLMNLNQHPGQKLSLPRRQRHQHLKPRALRPQSRSQRRRHLQHGRKFAAMLLQPDGRQPGPHQRLSENSLSQLQRLTRKPPPSQTRQPTLVRRRQALLRQIRRTTMRMRMARRATKAPSLQHKMRRPQRSEAHHGYGSRSRAALHCFCWADGSP